LQLLVSLPNHNHYQQEQAKAAISRASQMAAEAHVVDADNNPVTQSQQIVEALQKKEGRPDAILVEPLTSTALVKVAEAAVGLGVGWGLLNSDADYIERLRGKPKVPVFVVTRDHIEIGRIQGRQFAALLPEGGSVLYIQGPNTSAAAVQRTQGMESAKPANITIRALRSQWTEQSAYEAVHAWLKLSTSKPGSIQVVGCQYDGIAAGAKKAFREVASPQERDQWLALPITGVDGLPDEGQQWVNRGELTATVVALTTTAVAVEMAVKALQGGTPPPPVTLVELKSYPALEKLAQKAKKASTKPLISPKQNPS
jgi:ribose transport system substrate-binding protein